MQVSRLIAGASAVCALSAAAVLFAHAPARGFDFQGAPALVKHPAADITDTYLFPSPTNASNVVAVMDVYPNIPAGAGKTTFFDNTVLYTMKFDNNYGAESTTGGRPVENLVLQFSFGTSTTGSQTVTVYGPAAPTTGAGASSKLVTSTGSGFVNSSFALVTTSPITVFAGARRNPAFFNASQFFNIFPDRNQGSTSKTCLPSGTNTCPAGFASGTPTDYFANSNVLSIVVELPKSLLAGNGNGVTAFWATTSSQSGS